MGTGFNRGSFGLFCVATRVAIGTMRIEKQPGTCECRDVGIPMRIPIGWAPFGASPVLAVQPYENGTGTCTG